MFAIKMPSVNRILSKEGYRIYMDIDDMNPAQLMFSVFKKEVFPDSKFILSILYDTNIYCFFKKTNLFGMSLDKNTVTLIFERF